MCLVVVSIICLLSLSSVCMAYGRDAAASYARKWALSRNPDYKQSDADCANFVSQCIKAGGYQMTDSWYNKKVFGFKKISDNWGRASNLVNYAVNQKWGVKRKLGYSKNYYSGFLLIMWKMEI